MSTLATLESKPLSAPQLRRLVPGVNIVAYDALPGTLDELIGAHGMAAVLYITAKTDACESGHWTCCWHAADCVHFQDSYGLTPDAEEAWAPRDKRVQWGEDTPRLLALLQRSGQPVHVSRLKLQGWGPKIETCGLHVACRLVHRDMTDAQYSALLNSIPGVNPDGFVTLWALAKRKKL